MRTDWLVEEPSSGGPAGPFRTRVAGAGRRFPTTHLTTDDLMATTRHHTHIDLERLTGIRERRVSLGKEDSYSLATAAAMDALNQGTARRRIDRRGDQLQHHETSRRPDSANGTNDE